MLKSDEHITSYRLLFLNSNILGNIFECYDESFHLSFSLQSISAVKVDGDDDRHFGSDRRGFTAAPKTLRKVARGQKERLFVTVLSFTYQEGENFRQKH